MLVTATFLALLALTAAEGDHKDPHFAPGHDAIVHLFEWKWNDIATECENFLGPMGYGGVQVSPIQENLVIDNRPWWERYQPISYLWITRSGTREEFINMVARCNNAGVRIYVDVIMNHMSGNWKDARGTGNSEANTYIMAYYQVPYTDANFHHSCSVNNYNNPSNVRNCELTGLHDLDQSQEYVRSKLTDFLNDAIDVGVAGFRVDAAKHMWPRDLNIIYSRLKNLNTEHGFPPNARPYVFQEVIDYGNEAISKREYNQMASVIEFKYAAEISNAFRGNNLLKWLVNWGEQWGLLPPRDALVFVDNHDTQRGNSQVLTYKSSKTYKMAVAFMLAHPFGTPRVMSSFAFDISDQGPPHDGNGNIQSPSFNADNSCNGGWICEHRWRQIYNMVRFRNTVHGTSVNDWWDNGSNQIAFSRGNSGFVAFNGDQYDMRATVKTSLPPGQYCDVITGNLVNGSCTGKVVNVEQNGDVYVEISKGEEDGTLAIHVQAKL
ncbi:PREDICTED: alpha-amylase 1-like [Eufriesea mexicana]|uniref:alpha-amylase 1-like n=1 Tax=Eufriesea mexicana TaxID=516756 RepID=UPI00083C0741|nr:PREDICTED: alpha-amylase 1-like [Eufriesea mexicana]